MHTNFHLWFCQETLIFSNISAVYSSFPSATFCFTSLYYSSTMPTITSKHLQASPSTVLSSPLPFVILSSVLSFAFLISPLDRLQDRLYPWPHVYFYHFHFWCYHVSPFISRVLVFLSHIVVDCSLAGLYPFLLGSPARCTSYCNYLCHKISC